MATVAQSSAREHGGPLFVRVTADRPALREYLEGDRLFAAYAICDLDDREFGRTRWGAAFQDGQIVAVVLEYAGYTPQPLFVMGEPAGISAIVRDLIKPRAAYVAVLPAQIRALEAYYRVDAGPEMVRMWVDRTMFRPYPADVARMLPIESTELNRLYQLGFTSWLPSSAVADGIYYGIRIAGRLVSAAGTHVISREARLGVVGNVMTHASYRGRGYATATTSAVTAELLRTVDQVVLNVRADNQPALASYRRLGFTEHCRFEERMIHRFSPSGSLLGPLISGPLRRLFGPGRGLSG